MTQSVSESGLTSVSQSVSQLTKLVSECVFMFAGECVGGLVNERASESVNQSVSD